MNPDVAHLRGPLLESGALFIRASKELHEHRASDVEALAHDHIHLGVQFHTSLKERAQFSTHPPSGNEKDGQQYQRHERDRQAQRQHHDEDDEHEDDVTYDVRKEVRERLLGADDVIVQPTYQGPGLGSRKESNGHLLNVAKHLGPQVVDEPLADNGGDLSLDHL